MKKIAVLISGSGSNLRNLAAKIERDLAGLAEISVVVSNIPSVGGMDIAKSFKIPVEVLEDKTPKQRSITSKNIAIYNEFILLYEAALIAFKRIADELEKKGFFYTFFDFVYDGMQNLNSYSDFPERDLKDEVMEDIFYDAYTKDFDVVSEELEGKIMEEVSAVLFGFIEELKVMANFIIALKKDEKLLGFIKREEYDANLTALLKKYGVEYIFLAGFMRVLMPSFTNAWKGRIFNIHPSLLPAFGGAKAVKEALEYGVKYTGCTVHYVSAEVDGGRIIAQEAVPVLEGDTVESLHERIKEKEAILYPKVLEDLVNGKLG